MKRQERNSNTPNCPSLTPIPARDEGLVPRVGVPVRALRRTVCVAAAVPVTAALSYD
jgi:hypothetical protein